VNVDVLLPGWPPSPPGRPGGPASKPPGFVASLAGEPSYTSVLPGLQAASRLSSPVLATL